jgi:hypothetical protein
MENSSDTVSRARITPDVSGEIGHFFTLLAKALGEGYPDGKDFKKCL